MSRDEAEPLVAFVVRVSRDGRGRIQGALIRVRTGEAAAFSRVQEGARALTDMLTSDFGGTRMRTRSNRSARTVVALGLAAIMVGLGAEPVWAGPRRATPPGPSGSPLDGAPVGAALAGVFREADFAADRTLAAEAHHLVILDLEPAPRGRGSLENRARYRLDAGPYTFCLDEDEDHLVRLILENAAGKRVLRVDRPARKRDHPRSGRRHGRRPCETVTLQSGVYQLRVLHDSRHIDGAGRVAFLQPGSFRPGLLDDAGLPLGGLWALRPDPSPDPRRRPGRVVAPPPDRAVPPFTAVRPVVVDVASEAIDDSGLFTFANPRDPAVGTAPGLPLNLGKLDASGFWTLFADDGPTKTQTFFQTTPLVVTEIDFHTVSLGVELADGRLASVFLHETTFSPTTLTVNYDQHGADPAPPARFDVVFRFFPDGSQVGDLQEGEVALFQACQYQGKAAVFASDTPALAALSSAVVTLDKTAASVRLGNNTGVYLNTGLAYTGARQLVTVDTPCLDGTPIGSGTSSLSITPLAPSILLSSKKCEHCRLAGVDLSGVDLSGVDLTGAVLSQANLQGATLTQTILQGADLTGAKLAGATFRSAVPPVKSVVLTDAVLDQATGLAGSDLSQVDLSGASLRQVDLSNAKLFGAQLDRANLEGANLYGAFLTNNLERLITASASLRQAHLKNVNLSFAELSGANFSWANFYGDNAPAVLGCSTASPNYQGFTRGCAAAHAATMTGTIFDGAYLYGVDFTNAEGVAVSFEQAVLVGANLSAAKFSPNPDTGARTSLARAFLQGANFDGATLTDVDLGDAFVDFRPHGNGIYVLLNGQNHNVFAACPTAVDPNDPKPLCGQDVCVAIGYSAPTAVPETTGVTCPDGVSTSCGSADPAGRSSAWKSTIPSIESPPPGVPPAWYDQDATYTKAPASKTVVCGGQGPGAATFDW